MDIADLIDSINDRAGIIIFKTWGGKFYQNIKESYEVSFSIQFFFNYFLGYKQDLFKIKYFFSLFIR